MTYLTAIHTIEQYKLIYLFKKPTWGITESYGISKVSPVCVPWNGFPCYLYVLKTLMTSWHYDVIMTSWLHLVFPATSTYSWIAFVTLWHLYTRMLRKVYFLCKERFSFIFFVPFIRCSCDSVRMSFVRTKFGWHTALFLKT